MSVVRVIEYINDVITLKFYYFDSLNFENRMNIVKDQLKSTPICNYPDQEPIIIWKLVECLQQIEVECSVRVFQHLIMVWMITLECNMLPLFQKSVKQYGGIDNSQNVRLWLKFCINNNIVEMPKN